MKNIRAYLTTAAVSLVLVVVSAFFLSLSAVSPAAIGVPLVFGLVFAWSSVKAALELLDQDVRLADLFPAPVSTPVVFRLCIV